MILIVVGTYFLSQEILQTLPPILQLLKDKIIKQIKQIIKQIVEQTIEILEPEIYGVKFYSKDCNLVI